MDESNYLLISVHEEFVKRVEEENKRQNQRLASMENTLNQLLNMSVSVEKLATNMEHMVIEQKEQGERLKVLESKDGEMWRTAVSHLLVAVVGGVATYFLTKLGM